MTHHLTVFCPPTLFFFQDYLGCSGSFLCISLYILELAFSFHTHVDACTHHWRRVAKKAPDTGPSAAAVAAASLALQASPPRSGPHRRKTAGGEDLRGEPADAWSLLSAELPVARPRRPPARSCSGSLSAGFGSPSSLPPPPPPRCGGVGAAGAEPGLGAGSEDGRLRRSCAPPAGRGRPQARGLGG